MLKICMREYCFPLEGVKYGKGVPFFEVGALGNGSLMHSLSAPFKPHSQTVLALDISLLEE
jgi:hypothetical protein